MWHNAFGFDSFLSPPHTVLVITAGLQPWLLFRKLCELDSEIGKVVSLGLFGFQLPSFYLNFHLLLTEQRLHLFILFLHRLCPS